MQRRIAVYRAVVILFLCSAGVSCLKETPLPLNVDFGFELKDENRTSPVTVEVKNLSTGTDFYEWTFEGGIPDRSDEKNPEAVRFVTPGEHLIRLRAWNVVEESVKEIAVRVDSAVTIDFEVDVLINDFAPADVNIINKTRGATSYEWSFEGGVPSSSTLIEPGIVKYPEEGSYEVHLKVFNGSKYFETSKTFTLQPGMVAGFSFSPSTVDADMEAPLTLDVRNLTTNGLTYQWICEGATVHTPTAESGTNIRFENPGTYTVTLIADNLKEKLTVNREIVIKDNSGIFSFTGLRFGISEAKNTIGSFFSAKQQKVLVSGEINAEEIGKGIDIGFFALNSSFDYSYFLSPHLARDSAFPVIPGATQTTVVNIPAKYGIELSEQTFENIKKASDMDKFIVWKGGDNEYFGMNNQPVFALFKTEDGRRGIICLKEFVRNGAASHVVADLKIEKRPEE
ncbi:MAG: PKD domain protein [Proteiniphilum sp.]|jgi:PKD repeat protein|nr:PKD domain protein [Proteiniphilum sp.]